MGGRESSEGRDRQFWLNGVATGVGLRGFGSVKVSSRVVRFRRSKFDLLGGWLGCIGFKGQGATKGDLQKERDHFLLLITLSDAFVSCWCLPMDVKLCVMRPAS